MTLVEAQPVIEQSNNHNVAFGEKLFLANLPLTALSGWAVFVSAVGTLGCLLRSSGAVTAAANSGGFTLSPPPSEAAARPRGQTWQRQQ